MDSQTKQEKQNLRSYFFQISNSLHKTILNKNTHTHFQTQTNSFHMKSLILLLFVAAVEVVAKMAMLLQNSPQEM